MAIRAGAATLLLGIPAGLLLGEAKLQPSQTELLFRSVADCFLESEVHAEAHPMLCKHSESREQKKTNEFVFSAEVHPMLCKYSK